MWYKEQNTHNSTRTYKLFLDKNEAIEEAKNKNKDISEYLIFRACQHANKLKKYKIIDFTWTENSEEEYELVLVCEPDLC